MTKTMLKKTIIDKIPELMYKGDKIEIADCKSCNNGVDLAPNTFCDCGRENGTYWGLPNADYEWVSANTKINATLQKMGCVPITDEDTGEKRNEGIFRLYAEEGL